MKKYLLVGSLLSAVFFTPAAWSAGEIIGVNSAVKGNVTIADDAQVVRDAVIKDNVRLGEEVNSSRESTLQVLLNDQTVFTVGPDCVLTVDEFVYDPNKTDNGMTASVKKGMFRFMSGNIPKSANNDVSIDTPVASMGVRGTIVEGLVGEDAVQLGRKMGVIPAGAAVDENATLFILRGPGQNSTSQNRKGEIDVTSGGRTIVVRQSGFGALVPSAGSEPIGPFPVPDDVFDFFSAELRTRPKNNIPLEPVEIEFFDAISDIDWPGHDDNFHIDDDQCIFDPNDQNGSCRF